ncbi:MAG TPA: DUF2851 family protein, partial [Saprospiraceae bacterium]|nr:DUF2851 family protein [Saprospiraceae bacterium]
EHNTHPGPDFFDARIRIGDTTWAGNVEMHLLASEWLAHGHSADRAYDNVVLHVVLEEDQPIHRASGERLACVEMKERIPQGILARYQRLEFEQTWIPCQHFYPQVPDIVRLNWLDRVLVERLEQKTAAVAEALEATGQHWEEAFYRVLARSFGLKVNAEPFEALARSLPLLVLAKHKSHIEQVEALLFGQAGMLDGEFADAHPALLQREYRHLAHKYSLAPIAPSQWKFLRMRPANFPTVRLAQFAALVHRSAHLFSKVLEANTLRELEHLFEMQPSPYWQDRFQFDKPSIRRSKSPGRDFVHLLIINTLVPFLFFYGKQKHRDELCKRALRLLEELPPEANAVLDGWATLGTSARDAYQSQALLHLKAHYCDHKRCLQCAIGNCILK